MFFLVAGLDLPFLNSGSMEVERSAALAVVRLNYDRRFAL